MSSIEAAARCSRAASYGFRPHIALVVSEDCESLIRDTTAFEESSVLELLSRHEHLGAVPTQDAMGMPHSLEAFSVRFVELGDPGIVATRESLEHNLRQLAKERESVYPEWFAGLIRAQEMVPFETFTHPVAAVLMISSRTPDPMNTLARLYEESRQLPIFVNHDFLRYVWIWHDEDNNFENSRALLDQTKKLFGVHADLVRIGSSTPDANEENVTLAVRNMIKGSIIPYMEQCISLWQEQINSSRQGFAGRLFSVSKRFILSSSRLDVNVLSSVAGATQKIAQSSRRPPEGSKSAMHGNFDLQLNIYAYTTPEAQLRKLADFALMLQDYEFAYSTYDLLRRDFHRDKAWAYLASAQEMAAFSYLQTTTDATIKMISSTLDPLIDNSVHSFISRCNCPIHALRCILICTESLCSIPKEPEAALYAIKWLERAMDERLVGQGGYAALMERTSAAYRVYDERQVFSSHSRRTRKAAFWLLLAAREWMDAQFPNQSQRCVDECVNLEYGKYKWTNVGLLGRLLRQAPSEKISSLEISNTC